MTIQTTYTQARANWPVSSTRSSLTADLSSSGGAATEDVALISAAELSSLMETAYLLRSPRNA